MDPKNGSHDEDAIRIEPEAKRVRLGESTFQEPPTDATKQKQTQPHLEINTETSIEHELAHANILRTLQSPEPVYSRGFPDEDDTKYQTFPKLKEPPEYSPIAQTLATMPIELEEIHDLPPDSLANDPDSDGEMFLQLKSSRTVSSSLTPSTASFHHIYRKPIDAKPPRVPTYNPHRTPLSTIFTTNNKNPPTRIMTRTDSPAYPKFSDGQESLHPQFESSTIVFCDLDSEDVDASVLCASWLWKLGIECWPFGYRLVSISTRPPSGVRWDAYLYGHPSGKRFRSPNEFLPHLNWLIEGDIEQCCRCKYCNGEPADADHIIFLDSHGNVDRLTSDAPQDGHQQDATIKSGVDGGEGQAQAKVADAVPVLLIQENEASARDVPTTEVIIEDRQIIPDEDWNGEDYNSESDGSYSDSGDGLGAGLGSNSSDSDGDDMNDDDDDDSGNESETAAAGVEEGHGMEYSEGEEDELEREPLFPDLDIPIRKNIASKHDLILLDHADLLKSYIPCRKGEVSWYPSAHLNFQPPPADPEQFNKQMPFWPCLILATPPELQTHVSIIPLPLPTTSELSVYLDSKAVSNTYPEILSRQTIKTSATPSHYTPRPTHAPVFGPRTVSKSQLVPWRLLDASPPEHNRKFMATASHWQRRWNRAVIQAVGASSTWEPISSAKQPTPHDPTHAAVNIWRELMQVRWGVEVVCVGDYVHLVLPSPIVDRRLVGEPVLKGSKHRLMKIDRIVYQGSLSDVNREGEYINKVRDGRQKVGKVIVEGEVYAFRNRVGWFSIGKKRCTMKKVVIGRRFGNLEHEDEEESEALRRIAVNTEIEEVGDGFGEVGIIADESRGIWESWLSLEDSEEGASSLIEIVKSLEVQVENHPINGFDFNYNEEDYSDGE